MNLEQFPQSTIEDPTKEINPETKDLNMGQIQQEKNSLLQEIDVAIEQSDEELFKQEANLIKETIENVVNKCINEHKDEKFISDILEYIRQYEFKSLQEICKPELNMIGSVEKRIESWKKEKKEITSEFKF